MSDRPLVGHLVVPYMVDAARSPIDFKALDPDHVDECAMRVRCGICWSKIKRGPIAFIEQCPFLTGRRGWREGGDEPLLQPYDRMVCVLAHNWRSHRDPLGRWHFEALGELANA